MKRSLPPTVETLFWSLLTALGYFLLASLSLYATKGADNIAAVWPPSGYFLALLLLMAPRARLASFAGMIVASTAANMLSGAPALLSAAFTTANTAEGAVALWLINSREKGVLSFMATRSVGNFCVGAIAGSFASAGLATLLTGGDFEFFRSWLTTVALGMLIVTPPVVMLARLAESGLLRHTNRSTIVESVVMMTIAAGVTAICFSQAEYPVTFIPCVAVVAASYRLGPFGAAGSVFIVTIIASLMTSQGLGPIAHMDKSPTTIVLFLQFYLLTLLGTALPLAALLVGRQRLAKRLEQSNRWLLQAEAAALVGHWRVDLIRWTIQWSDQAYRIHGIEPGTVMTVQSSLDLYMPEDATRMRKVLEQAALTGAPFEFQGRIIRPDDEVRDISSHGSIELSRSGKPVGIFGTIQDVTETVENARMLEDARSVAEAAANTDALTGLPNRRHTLAFLERALVGARENGAPLAVAIFDIDHFKRINDVHGHSVGDEVIRRVGHRAKAVLREEDMVGRFGGEEFVCILQRSSAQAAELVAERIRQAIEGGGRSTDNVPPATVSIGVAVYADEAGVEELLQRADEALYVAKREGRNRLRMAA
ncbi:sensor domain-containing diguanylate cyclase [Sphingopyxis sp. QXT-31]|uniref:sensor domain-containing diguanylate cyclase n=1 Tax=Sphingopyxis sp. QXT-31 TaxID=1357916 RepID=UPI0009790AF4|nr:sensor domain-containing diguanylate cyclase [Sphingopyxis sp. QXT-31]APZ97191.1 sensor domain-containing diguanylate cyclase [Sphingopyxis sp. QXT-31]